MNVLPKALRENKILLKDMSDVLFHGVDVSNLAYALGKEMELSEQLCYELAIAGVIHDIGKIRLTRYINSSKNTMVIEEIKYTRTHSLESYEILQKYDYSEFILKTVLYHHENYDGSGYPEHLKEEEIPIGARILRVCDTFAALTSDRIYREKFDKETAMELMIDEIKNLDLYIFLAFQRMMQEKELGDFLKGNQLDLEHIGGIE